MILLSMYFGMGFIGLIATLYMHWYQGNISAYKTFSLGDIVGGIAFVIVAWPTIAILSYEDRNYQTWNFRH